MGWGKGQPEGTGPVHGHGCHCNEQICGGEKLAVCTVKRRRAGDSERPVMPPESMVLSRSMLLLRTMSGSLALPQQGSVSMSTACVDVGGPSV